MQGLTPTPWYRAAVGSVILVDVKSHTPSVVSWLPHKMSHNSELTVISAQSIMRFESDHYAFSPYHYPKSEKKTKGIGVSFRRYKGRKTVIMCGSACSVISMLRVSE